MLSVATVFRWLLMSALGALAATACVHNKETTVEADERPRKKRNKKRAAPAVSATAAASVPSRPPPPPPPPAVPADAPHPGLRDPTHAGMRAPDTFVVRFDTTKGPLVMRCDRSWAPHGADRFYSLVKIGFFRDMALFRMVTGFVVQFGIHGDPAISAAWKDAELPVDPVVSSNTRGRVTFAMAGAPTTRTTQLYINLGDNARLDAMGFSPVCEVTEGMDVADRFFDGHGERVSSKQGDIQREGNAFLRKNFPGLDFIVSAAVIGEP